MLQILTLIAMERPVTFSAEDVRDEKVLHTTWITQEDFANDYRFAL